MNHSQSHLFFWAQKYNSVLAALLIFGGSHGVLRADVASCGATQFPVPEDEPGAAAWCRDEVYAHSFEVKTLRAAIKRFKSPIPENGPQDENQCFKWTSDGAEQYSAHCSCQEGVESFRLIGETQAIRKINAAEAADVKSVFCTDKYSLASRSVVKINVLKEFVSKAVRRSMRFHSDGGSCHGEFGFETYALRTGHNYKLSEVLNKTTKAELQHALLSSFLLQYHARWDGESKNYPRSAEENKRTHQFAMSDASRYLASIDTAHTGFVIDKNKVWINIPLFLFGCAGGNLYPVSLPSHLIALEFKEQLEKDAAAGAH